MNPKEKAKELVEDMMLYELDEKECTNGVVHYKISHEVKRESAIKCAIKAIDRILEAIDWHELEVPNEEIDYWNEVKMEVECLRE